MPDLGVLFYTSILFIPLGVIRVWSLGGNLRKIVLLWFFLAPLPAVLSRDLISMVRGLNLILPFSILEGAGLYALTSYCLKIDKKRGLAFAILVIALIVVNFAIFLDRYFVHFPKEYSSGWLYGYRQAVNEINEKDTSNYQKVIFSDVYGQPYIYYLFYSKYPPQKFQSQVSLDQPTVDVGTVRKIDNLEFRHIFWPGDRGIKNGLFIGSLEELPDQDIKSFKEYKILRDINFLDGQHAFRIVESE